MNNQLAGIFSDRRGRAHTDVRDGEEQHHAREYRFRTDMGVRNMLNQRPLYWMATYTSDSGNSPLMMFRRGGHFSGDTAKGCCLRQVSPCRLQYRAPVPAQEYRVQASPVASDRVGTVDTVPLSGPAFVANLMALAGPRKVQDAPGLGDLGGDVGCYVDGGKPNDGSFGIVFRALNPDLEGIGKLQLVKELGEAYELWIAGSAHARTLGLVGNTMMEFNSDLHDQRSQTARLRQEQRGWWRDWRHQLLMKSLPVAEDVSDHGGSGGSMWRPQLQNRRQPPVRQWMLLCHSGRKRLFRRWSEADSRQSPARNSMNTGKSP